MRLIKKKVRFAPIGYTKYLKGLKKTHTMFRQGKILESLAVKSWEIAPGNTTISSKAYFLEGQLERITGTAYTDNPYAVMHGGVTTHHAPTRAYQLKDIWMVNGSIYKGLHRFLLHHNTKLSPKMNYFPPAIIDTEIKDAAIYSSYDGNEFFGLWLTDDCTNYKFAASEGFPITTNIFTSPHMFEYEELLGMNPYRTNAAYLQNALFFDDDWGNNNKKQQLFNENKDILLSKFSKNSHPGVFILRRNSGKTRIMLNEIEIAEQLRDKYGFKIVDVTQQSVNEILSACAGARMVVGIEGSHLMHGLTVLEPGAAVLTLQPPNRFCGVLKITTDMQSLKYGFVVGIQKEENFYINLEEVERTIAFLEVLSC
ncbi:glycosyltransferase 61 family protein [Flavobacterium sp. ACN6]|uniref:glycosyltransferase 61 family protein n=1 Tax=Flavobacterium sp. ACN6 TaxID=1920426 RepID=UPI000BB2DCB6|nr:glycosyltransferase family 61 protein [Flavobacterium sp. ACN6]PBJ13086.1 hypothetical protein BSF42_14850 [Flavobacterium sp. ACN6]